MATVAPSDRSSEPAEPLRLRFGAFELDEADARLTREGRAIALPPKLFAVLCAFARRKQWLNGLDVARLSDGSLDARYAFRRALYRHVFYQGLGTARRAQLHQRVALSSERSRAVGGPVTSAELASHYESSHDLPAAIHHYADAAQNALRHFAPVEAMALSARAGAAAALPTGQQARRARNGTAASAQRGGVAIARHHRRRIGRGIRTHRGVERGAAGQDRARPRTGAGLGPAGARRVQPCPRACRVQGRAGRAARRPTAAPVGLRPDGRHAVRSRRSAQARGAGWSRDWSPSPTWPTNWPGCPS